jgi:isocitrate/isopropylmalate dehydrogenase
VKEYNIALVPGDGVGEEVVAAARQVLEEVQKTAGQFRLNFKEYLAGKSAYDSLGTALPAESLRGMRQSDATILGALSAELIPPPSPTGQLRKELELFADVRPIKSFRGAWALRPDIDIICIRENMQGFLADRNMFKGHGEFMPTEDVVMSVRVLSRVNCERIARYAFEFARVQKRKKVTVAHKTNVLRMGCGFFLDIVRKVAEEFKDIRLEEEYADSIANNLIIAPEKYDVLLATNLFGDILSDEAAALVSNLVPTANIGPEAAVFRPIHEARLKEAGQNITNPLSAILCGSMMLRHLGELTAAQQIEDAVQDVLIKGAVRPRDLGGSSSLTEVTAAVCDKFKNYQGR